MSWIEDKYKKEIDDSLLFELDIQRLHFGCWIDLQGKVYRTRYAEHCILAHQILCIKYNKGFDDLIEFENNDELIKKGWILIQRVSPFCKTYNIYYKQLFLVNPKQHDILRKLKKLYQDYRCTLQEIELE